MFTWYYSFCLYTILTLELVKQSTTESVCYDGDKLCSDSSKNLRFLFYDVNPPEGFNLRRDVYLRYAIFAHKLKNIPKHDNVRLVLPPWSRLYHWKKNERPEYLPWGTFFDVESLRSFAPVVEMYEYFNLIQRKYSKVKIDEVYVLQHYEDMFESGNFEDRMSVEKCQQKIQTNFFFYDNLTSDNIKCLSFHGYTSQLLNVLEHTTATTILIDHAEVALHDSFGDKTYWQARRSMRFNKNLIKIADDFRKTVLNSTDKADATLIPPDWRLEKPRRSAKGGPYLCVHLRRRDFLWGRSKDVPTIAHAAQQIKSLSVKLQLDMVFVATDAPRDEYRELVGALAPKKVVRYEPDEEIRAKYKEGGVAIIEQAICSHAKFFIGTHESTFSFRIQEEREIIGFKPEMTFNRLCGEDLKSCKKPSTWKIVY